MTPKRIKKKKAGATYTAPMKNTTGAKKKPAAVIKKDAREEIVALNATKLKSDMTEMYNAMKAKGIDGNSGTAGFLKNRMELDAFVESAKKEGLTNAQALAKFKSKYKL